MQETVEQRAQPVDTFINIVFHAVPEKLHHKANEGVAAEGGDAAQIFLGNIASLRRLMYHAGEGVVRQRENVPLQTVTGETVEHVVNGFGMLLASVQSPLAAC